MFYINRCDINWVKERILYCQHNQLTTYFLQRSRDQRIEAESAGWTTNRIIEKAFVVGGIMDVPSLLMRVIDHCYDLDSIVVWRKLQEMDPHAPYCNNAFILKKWKEFADFLRYRRPQDTMVLDMVQKKIAVWEVMLQ